jgi:hypothetical protein
MPRCGAKAHENDSSSSFSSSFSSSYSAFFEDEHEGDDEDVFHRKISKEED